MSDFAFAEALAHVLEHEGGYVNDPDDPGGETNMGISRRSYPHEDIAGMTLERAGEIYRKDYWEPCQCDNLPHPLDLMVFDSAVNSGVERASQWVQHAVGAQPDGIIGPVTLSLVAKYNPWTVTARVAGMRLTFLTSLRHFDKFGRGWTRRVAEALLQVRDH